MFKIMVEASEPRKQPMAPGKKEVPTVLEDITPKAFSSMAESSSGEVSVL